MTLRQRLSSLSTRKQSSILSASLVLAVTFGLSAILGFLRSRFLYAHFFSCCVLDLDAYNAAFRLPDLIFKLLVTGALSASFIPVFSNYLHKDEKQAYLISSTVINLLFLFFLIIASVVFVFAVPLTKIIAAGFSPSQLSLMVDLTRILLLAQIFFLLSNFVTAILQVNQIFIVPALSPIVYNIFIIASIFILAPIWGVYGVVWGAVVGAFFHLAIQIPVVLKTGFHYSFSIQTRLAGVREVIRLMIPRSLSLGLGEIENTVTLFFATTLPAGSLSLLNLALQLIYLPSRIFGTTIGQASLPILSKNIAKNELDLFRRTVNRTILQSLFIALPITVIILIHRVAIVRLAFGSRHFPWSATLITAKALAFLTPAIVSQAVIQILVRSFYALHDTKTPLKISAISLIINVSTSYLFVTYTDLGVLGLALSASIGNVVQLIGLVALYVKQVDGHNWEPLIKAVLKIFLATIITATFTWLCLRFLDIFVLDTSKTANLIILFSVSTLIGLISYLLTCRYLAVEEYRDYERYFFKLKRLISP